MPFFWYGIYDDTSKEVETAGFFPDPESVPLDPGKSLTEGQPGDIPADLVTLGDPLVRNYVYNTTTNLVEAKA